MHPIMNKETGQRCRFDVNIIELSKNYHMENILIMINL